MRKRSKLSKKNSKRLFTKTASRHHRLNNPKGVKRGGMRF